MTTALALANVTDRGKFERIAIQVLRQFDAECAAVLRCGTNALDEPIPSPIDAFCRVPGVRPTRFILIECTTTDPTSLRVKWLSEPSAEGDGVKGGSQPRAMGDLVKAAGVASRLRASSPNASCKVHLVVNQTVKLSLYEDVQKSADKLGVECEIWDLTRLSDLLDRPEGQVFRRELGLPARDMSRGLLTQICQDSLEQAQREALTDPSLWVDRMAGMRLRTLIEAGGHRLIALVAEPGRGKTSLGLQLLDEHLRIGGLGLFVDAERVGECNNLDEAVGQTLRSLARELAPDQERNFRRFLDTERPMLVLLDDVNRAGSPARLLQKVVTWIRPAKSASTGGGGCDSAADDSNVVVLVPIWPVHAEEVSTRLKESPWVTMLDVDRMELSEADEALRRVFESAGSSVGPARRVEIVDRLERDPVLIGLLGRLLDSDKRRDPVELSADVIGHYLERCVEDTVIQTGGLLKSDVLLELDRLADYLLRHRDLNPCWSTVRMWFSGDPDAFRLITALTKHGGIIRTRHDKAGDRLNFRHDRLMQEVLARSLATAIEGGDSPDALFDPFFAETTGQAIRRTRAGGKLLRDVADRCPLALFEAVKASRPDDESATRAAIDEAIAWSARWHTNGEVLPAVLDSIAWTLLSSDSPQVLEFVRLLPRHSVLMLAGLRNGSADCGVSYLSGRSYFCAETRDLRLERTIEVALARHGDRIVSDLGTILRDPGLPDMRRKGAIELAGYVGSTELERAVSECFREAHDQGLVFIPTLWSSLRCLGEDPGMLAAPMVEAWGGLSDEHNEKWGGSDRGTATEALRMAFAQGVPDRTVRFLTREFSSEEGDFRWRLFRVLEFVDHPDAIEHRIRYVAHELSTLEPGHFSLASQDLTRPWDPYWKSTSQRLSDASRERIRGLWDDPGNDTSMRETAFRIWLTQCGGDDLPTLMSIETSSPLFHDAVRERARLGDVSCVPALIDEIRECSWYFRLAPPVWCLELHQLAVEFLKSFRNQIPRDFTGGWSNDHYALSNLLMRILDDVAERLITDFWEDLQYSPLFIQAALFVGTPTCLAHAEAGMRACPREIDVLKHVDHRFSVLATERQDSVALEHLERLLPYVDRLDPFSIFMLADFFNRRGHQEWVRRNLQGYLAAGHRVDVCPTESDIQLELDQFAGDEKATFQLQYWATEGSGRLIPPGQLIAILSRWLANTSEPRAGLVAAEVVGSVGTRRDLEILERCQPTASQKQQQSFENARFRVKRRSLQ